MKKFSTINIDLDVNEKLQKIIDNYNQKNPHRKKWTKTDIVKNLINLFYKQQFNEED